VRHHSQPLVRSSATTSSTSPTLVGNSVVSYAVCTIAVPDEADRCRTGTHPAPCDAVTKTNSGHSVSRSPTVTWSPTFSLTGGRLGILWATFATTVRTRQSSRWFDLAAQGRAYWSASGRYLSTCGRGPERPARTLRADSAARSASWTGPVRGESW